MMLYSDESNIEKYVNDGIRQIECVLTARERVVTRMESLMSQHVDAMFGSTDEVTYE
jgi:hypothetical protein